MFLTLMSGKSRLQSITQASQRDLSTCISGISRWDRIVAISRHV